VHVRSFSQSLVIQSDVTWDGLQGGAEEEGEAVQHTSHVGGLQSAGICWFPVNLATHLEGIEAEFGP
jgi:hypothetical protein